jgi:hypothetical protein
MQALALLEWERGNTEKVLSLPGFTGTHLQILTQKAWQHGTGGGAVYDGDATEAVGRRAVPGVRGPTPCQRQFAARENAISTRLKSCKGAQFTGFTGTKVQILTPEELSCRSMPRFGRPGQKWRQAQAGLVMRDNSSSRY